jgi:uncharacterized protein involved in exopolysaccharide biosynthesis
VEHEIKSFSDYLAMLQRRASLVVFLFLGLFVLGTYVIYSIAPTYVSSATFRVQQQSITDYVEGTANAFVDEQVQLVRQRVMSVERLSSVIDEFGLYPEETGGAPATYDAVGSLRSAIELVPEYTEVFNQSSGRSALVMMSFTMQFSYREPEMTQQVAEKIAGLFLNENQRIRTSQAEETIDFLAEDLADAEREVDEAAEVLADFRERHAGNLPDMSDYNLQSMERIERQIEMVDEDIRDARDRKQLLETELADPNLLATVYDENGEPIVGTAQALANAQRERIRLLSVYSPEHPDVLTIERTIAALESDLQSSAANISDIENELELTRTQLSVARQRYTADHPTVTQLVRRVATLEDQLEYARSQPGTAINAATQDPVVQQLRTRIRAQEDDIRAFQARRAELVQRLNEAEGKMLRMPQIEREFAGLTRNYEAAVARANEARAKLDEAKTAGRLEAEGGGARFILTDPPQLPKGPDKPNRLSLLILAFVLAGIFGVGAAIAADSADGTIRESEDLVKITNAPPIAVIPYIETSKDRRRRIAMNILKTGAVAGAIALVALIIQTPATT